MLKIKTRSFYSYFTIKYIFPTITPSLSLYISLSLFLSHTLSHRSWLSIFLLFSRQPNRIQSLPLSCSISRSLSLSCFRFLIGFAGWFSYYFLGNQTDSRLNFSIILPPIRCLFYFSWLLQCLGFVLFCFVLFCFYYYYYYYFSRNLIQVDFDHFNYLLDTNVSFNFEFKFYSIVFALNFGKRWSFS